MRKIRRVEGRALSTLYARARHLLASNLMAASHTVKAAAFAGAALKNTGTMPCHFNTTHPPHQPSSSQGERAAAHPVKVLPTRDVVAPPRSPCHVVFVQDRHERAPRVGVSRMTEVVRHDAVLDVVSRWGGHDHSIELSAGREAFRRSKTRK
jgi:hypothetical protein